MAKINFQTSAWGGKDGRHHIEFNVNGRTLMVTVDDNHVHVVGPVFEDRDARSINAFTATLPGGRFHTVQKLYEAQDRAHDLLFESLKS